MNSDPLVHSFLQFMRGLEMASQLTGESFRSLQANLHYPEVYKELATNNTYPCSRQVIFIQ